MEQLLKKGRKVPAATRSADMASFLECWDLLGEFADALPVEARRAGATATQAAAPPSPPS
jgi:hypothetical protein